MNISFPGSDVLFSSSPSLSPAGFGTLGLQNYGSSATRSGSPPASKVNPYQQAYDTIITASNAYLQNSLLNGPPATLPEYTGATSASAFAQLNTTLATLKQGLGQGLFTGTGFNALA